MGSTRHARMLSLPPEKALNPYNIQNENRRASRAPRIGSVVANCFSLRFLAILAVLAVLGCQADEITRYRAPRTDEPSVRLIAAIFSQGEKSWVFKLQGPEPEIASRADAFTEFIRSVRFAEKADPPVTWKLPDGWQSEGVHPDRFATIRTGPKDDAPLITVWQLTGPQAGSVIANVNRWRGQLGLRPIGEAALEQVCKKLTVEGAGEAVIVDMVGPGRLGPPMVSAPPTGRAPPPVPGDKKPITYGKPDGWTEYRDPKGVATVAFHAGEGDAVEITVTRLPGAAGGLAANVNRWRMQIGLPEATPAELQGAVRPLNLAAGPANYVDLLGPDAGAAPRQRIIGVMLPRGQLTWFIKMRGPAGLVTREQAAFDAFVGSIRFDDE
jgi:hypothetical protein